MTLVEALAYATLAGWTAIVLTVAWRSTQRAERALADLEQQGRDDA